MFAVPQFADNQIFRQCAMLPVLSITAVGLKTHYLFFWIGIVGQFFICDSTTKSHIL